MYWQVDNDEIVGTIEITKASQFHICTKQRSKQFLIVHPESMKTVTVQRKSVFDRKTKPLKLMSIPTPRDTYLKLQHCNGTNKSVAVPQTAIAWEGESPFLIKFSNGHFSRYIAAIECYDENTAVKDDADSKKIGQSDKKGKPTT